MIRNRITLIMKNLISIGFPMWLALIATICSCDRSHGGELEMIHIEGVSWACNVNTSYAFFGSIAETENDLDLVLSASEGDLLYMMLDDLQLYYRYRPEDGNHLAVSFDTLNSISAYINGDLYYIELSKTASLEAFENLTAPEIEQLSALYIDNSNPERLYKSLQIHESVLQGKGLILETDFKPEHYHDLLSIVHPEFLVMSDAGNLPSPEKSICLSNLELLWVDENLPALAKQARCCSNLESLIIADWDPMPGELLPLESLHKLRSLTLAECGLTSLSVIEPPSELNNLYLVSCDTLSDINQLSNYQNLNRLSLSLCSQVNNTDVIKQIKDLEYLSFPPSVSHQEFQDLTSGCSQLEVIELIDCENIKDLSPLQSLPGLNTLVLQLDKEQLGNLDTFTDLKLVILTSDIFQDNPKYISDLRSSLPTTTIVPGSGLCLGSGWLLLLIPFLFIFRFMIRRKYYNCASN